MKIKRNTKGFTLIELLIVIAIIGILAVAFVPTLLNAPAKGRDAQRVANLSTLRTVLLNEQLKGAALPATGCVTNANFGAYLTATGGKILEDPQAANLDHSFQVAATKCQTYTYVKAPGAGYSFGLYAKMEAAAAGNVKCSALTVSATDLAVKPDADNDSCYAILVQ